MERIFCTFPAYVCILLEKNDEVLLIRRLNTGWMDGVWSIPGGAVEENEPLIMAAIREAQEELGICILPEHLRLFHVIDNHIREKKIFGFYFSAREWQGNPVNNEPDKHSEIKWFNYKQLPDEITEYARKVITNHQANLQYSLFE